MGRTPSDVSWSVYSAYGRVCCYIAVHPTAAIREIAIALGLTDRQVARLIHDLVELNVIQVERHGPHAKRLLTSQAQVDDPLFGPIDLQSALAPGVAAVVKKWQGERPPIAESRHARLRNHLRQRREELREHRQRMTLEKERLLEQTERLLVISRHALSSAAELVSSREG